MLKDIQQYLKPNKRDLWLPKEPTREIERGIWNENYLKRLHETLKQFRRKKYPQQRKSHAKCMSYDSPTEAATMVLPSTSFDENIGEKYQSNVLIQKTIKGRAIQSMLQRGMSKFQDIIDEAKSSNSIGAVRKLFPKEFSQQIDSQEQIISEYKRIEEALKSDTKLQDELKKVESKDAGNLLNFLEKELNRLQGEKRAHALCLLAERERYRREAVTLGENDFEDQFKNDAITLYLENILLDGVSRATDDSSRNYIRKIAQKIDRKASKTVTFEETVEEFSNESNTENVSDDDGSELLCEIPDQRVVMELLKDNMVPQIVSRIKNEQMLTRQRQFLTLAHDDLYREEIEMRKIAEEREICSEIFEDFLEIAMKCDARQDSIEAEILATQIVEQILNEIIDGGSNNNNFDASISITDSSSRDYDGDDSNVQSTSETESTTDILAKRFVQDVLNDIIEGGIVVTTTASETTTENTSDSY